MGDTGNSKGQTKNGGHCLDELSFSTSWTYLHISLPFSFDHLLQLLPQASTGPFHR
jgi:hypothetical protein